MTLIERSENLIWTCSGAKTKPSSGAKRNYVKPPNGLLARTQSFHFAGERDCLQQNIKITLTDCHHHLTRLPCHVGGRGDDCQGDGRVGRESRQAELENEEKQHLLLKFHQCTTAIIEVAALPKYQFSFYFFLTSLPAAVFSQPGGGDQPQADMDRPIYTPTLLVNLEESSNQLGGNSPLCLLTHQRALQSHMTHDEWDTN